MARKQKAMNPNTLDKFKEYKAKKRHIKKTQQSKNEPVSWEEISEQYHSLVELVDEKRTQIKGLHNNKSLLDSKYGIEAGIIFSNLEEAINNSEKVIKEIYETHKNKSGKVGEDDLEEVGDIIVRYYAESRHLITKFTDAIPALIYLQQNFHDDEIKERSLVGSSWAELDEMHSTIRKLLNDFNDSCGNLRKLECTYDKWRDEIVNIIQFIEEFNKDVSCELDKVNEKHASNTGIVEDEEGNLLCGSCVASYVVIKMNIEKAYDTAKAMAAELDSKIEDDADGISLAEFTEV